MRLKTDMKLTEQEKQLLRHLRNWKVHTGEVPSYRKLMNLLGYKSTRSISLILESLIEKDFIKKIDGNLEVQNILNEEVISTQTVEIPLVGNIACGEPILAIQNVEEMITVSTRLARPPYKYFILRASGDSMNKKNIQNGTLVLVRQQETAKDGDIVVAILDDFCTLKEFKRKDNFILLIPQSTNEEHRPILLTDDFRVQGVVIAVLPDL